LSGQSIDPVKLAVTNVLKLSKCLEGINEREDLERLVSRASSFPSLMLSSGLVPTITFWMSKVVTKKTPQRNIDLKRAFSELLKYLLGYGEDSGECGEDLPKLVADDLRNDGYATSLALLIAGLAELGYIELGEDELGGDSPQKTIAVIARKLLELMESERAAHAEADMLDYAVEVKKLTAALFK